MNITILNTLTGSKNVHTFKGTGKKKVDYPQKYVFTEFEKDFNELLQQLYTLESNIKVQKQNLKYYYSAQDRYDYRRLLQEKQNLLGRLKRIAKSVDMNFDTLQYNLTLKKEYNRYAPKIFRAKSKEELVQLKELISRANIYQKARDILINLIEQKKI